MIGGCVRIIVAISIISTTVRGSENGVTELMFRRILASDSEVPAPTSHLRLKSHRGVMEALGAVYWEQYNKIYVNHDLIFN